MLKFACQKDCWHCTACPAALEHFGSAALSRSLSAPAPPCSAAWIPSPPWYAMGSRGTACFTVLLTTGPGGLLLWHLEHLSPSFCTDLGVCEAVSHSSLSQLLFCSSYFVFPSFSLHSQRHRQQRFLAQLWPAARPFPNMGQLRDSSRRTHPDGFPATKALPQEPTAQHLWPLRPAQSDSSFLEAAPRA